jgi:putative redox protein
MPIELRRDTAAAMAQKLMIRSHSLTVDGSIAEGGDDAGPSAHDLYDAALGACKALTVMWYARKKGMTVEDIRTVVTRDDSQERSGTYQLAVALQIKGDLTDAQLDELAGAAKKCPVHKLMTVVTTQITTQVERLP